MEYLSRASLEKAIEPEVFEAHDATEALQVAEDRQEAEEGEDDEAYHRPLAPLSMMQQESSASCSHSQARTLDIESSAARTSRSSSVSPRTHASLSTRSSSLETLSKTDFVVQKYHEARASHERVVCFLVDNGFDNVNSRRSGLLRASYPLHRAVKRNDQEMVRMLLAWGADATQVDSSKRTPYDYAEKRNRRGSHEEVLRILAQAGQSCIAHTREQLCQDGLTPGMEASHGTEWESFIKQLAQDPLVSRRRLAAIAPQVRSKPPS